jgi:nucleotidyltransferase substrate binding protein (TIGR01987 family)
MAMDGKPDIQPLENAIRRLEEALTAYQADIGNDIIRDGLVQRFEFTYELSHKMLKRYLEYAAATPELLDQMSFQDLIRTGSEQGLLLGDWPRWRGYRDMRSRTSHTYDEGVALSVVAGIPAFLEEARYLRDRLRDRLA